MTRYPWLWNLRMWLQQAGVEPSECFVTLKFHKPVDEAKDLAAFQADQLADWRKAGNEVISADAFPSAGQLNGLHYRIGNGG